MLNRGINCVVIGINHMDAMLILGDQTDVEEIMSHPSGEMFYGYGVDNSRLQEDALYMVLEALEMKYGYTVVNLFEQNKELIRVK